MACPVTVRGKWYPSIAAAARANRVTARTCLRHLERYGHLDNLNRVKRTRPDRHKPVVLNGIRFASVTAAAEALGVDRKTIRNTRNHAAARDTVMRAMTLYLNRQEAA